MNKPKRLVDTLDPEARALLDHLLLVNKSPELSYLEDDQYLEDSYALLETGAIVVTVEGDRLSVEINPDFEAALRALQEAEDGVWIK